MPSAATTRCPCPWAAGSALPSNPRRVDRRAKIVSLTESGQLAMSEMARDHERLSAELMAAVDASDADGLLRGVHAIATRLRAMVEAAASAGEQDER